LHAFALVWLIEPIIEQRWVSCHQAGQIGVGALASYDDVRVRSHVVVQQVESREMPPWFADAECNQYNHDPSLSDEEVGLFAAWHAAGAPAGDPADDTSAPPAPPPQLVDIDHNLTLPEPYTPDPNFEDDYRCFVIDWPEQVDTYVTGFGVRVDNATTVHHLIAYIASPSAVAEAEALDAAEEGPGYTCFGGPLTSMDGGTNFFGAWAPGVLDAAFPDGTGVPVLAGSKIVVQMHYNLVTHDGAPDQTGIVVTTADHVDKDAKFQFWANPGWLQSHTMDIPAGDPDVEHSFAFDPTSFVSGGQPFTIYSAAKPRRCPLSGPAVRRIACSMSLAGTSTGSLVMS
jgi:hypothetical protein